MTRAAARVTRRVANTRYELYRDIILFVATGEGGGGGGGGRGGCDTAGPDVATQHLARGVCKACARPGLSVCAACARPGSLGLHTMYPTQF